MGVQYSSVRLQWLRLQLHKHSLLLQQLCNKQKRETSSALSLTGSLRHRCRSSSSACRRHRRPTPRPRPLPRPRHPVSPEPGMQSTLETLAHDVSRSQPAGGRGGIITGGSYPCPLPPRKHCSCRTPHKRRHEGSHDPARHFFGG